jgi:bifunctional non-homologous end joining protein LigD
MARPIGVAARRGLTAGAYPHRGGAPAGVADLAAAVGRLSARTLVLDGEIAIYDQQLRSRFEWLREPDPDAVTTPPLLMAFDVLYLDRRDQTARPLRDRRARLEDVVAGSELVFPVRRLAPDGLEAWKQVVERGYEGYVTKDERTAYEGSPPRSRRPSVVYACGR